MSDIEITTFVTMEAVAEQVARSLRSPENAVKFLTALDMAYADWDFTKAAYAYFKGEMEEYKRVEEVSE